MASQLLESQAEPICIPRAAEAAYALSLCLIQGFGCDADPQRAKEFLILSVEADCETSRRYAYRLLGGLGAELPERLLDCVAETAEMNVVVYGDMKQAQDLLQIDP